MGPIRSRALISQRQTLVKVLGYSALISTTGGGVVANIINLLPSNSPNWGERVGWDEYRLLAAELKISYLGPYGTSASGMPPVACIVDMDDASAALTSYSSALCFGSCKIFHSVGPQSPNRIVYRMAGDPTDQWLNTAATAPGPPGSFKLYLSGGAVSQACFLALVTYVCQFRGPE
jgi:hypothetical protein